MPLRISIQANIIGRGPNKYCLFMDQIVFLKSSGLITVISLPNMQPSFQISLSPIYPSALSPLEVPC